MHRPRHPSGFTLVELLVSIAIALILVLGVNTVFKATSQTVGAGQQLLSSNRDARTILQTMLADLGNVDPVPAPGSTVGDGPFFVIRSDRVDAYLTVADQQSATSPTDPSTDTKLYANFPGNQAPVPFIHTRNHRLDRLGFFSRGLYARQTTSDGTRYVSTSMGNEAWTVYGHAMQPNKGMVTSGSSAAWCNPGDPSPSAGKNDNNYLAADFMLARYSMVLIPTPAATDRSYVADSGGLSPLRGSDISSAITDLAATSISNYGSSSRANGIYTYGPNGANFGSPWWDQVINFRFQASPFIPSAAGQTTAKINPAALAQSAPDLIRGCSQFIVEYAGNFYTKNPDGSAVDTTGPNPASTPANPLPPLHVPIPDPTGQVDFFLTTNSQGNVVRQTRWYGFPRMAGGTPASVTVASGNVVPARDVFKAVTPAGVTPTWDTYADAEHFTSLPQSADYWSGMSRSASYTAAWGPNVQYMAFPKMIRVIIEIADREGRLNQPQRYEFVYDVQQ